jgi:nucleoid DNA-binding protein
MKKKELIKNIAEENKITNIEAGIIFDNIFNSIIESVKKGDKAFIPKFGIFSKKEVKGRLARNPRTGEQVEIPNYSKIKFSPALSLKKLLK